MNDPKIQPERITKPIQLLAAWLAGLLLVNTAFLTAACAISSPSWVRGALVIASIVNVPLFLACLFLLQTKFRPQMQEDSYYSKYLESNTGVVVKGGKLQAAISGIKSDAAEANQRYIEMFSQFREELASLGASVNSLEGTSHSGSEQQSEELSRLAVQLSEASRTNLRVQLNDLAPNYNDIRADLVKRRVPLGATFGSSSAKPEVPEILTIGFGKAVPLDSLRTVVDVAQSHGFDHIHFAEGDTNTNRIYVGSYIYRSPDEPPPVPLAEVRNIIDSPQSSLADVVARIAYLQAKG